MDLRNILADTNTDNVPPRLQQTNSAPAQYSPIDSPRNPQAPPYTFASPTATYNHVTIPAAHQYQQHRDSYSATTPTARTSVPPPFGHPSQSPYPLSTGVPNYASHPSQSPLSAQTPHSLRESPMSVASMSYQAPYPQHSMRERERSVSVSPKAQVPSRAHSIDQRQSSRERPPAQVAPAASLRNILQQSPPQPSPAPLHLQQQPPPPPYLEHSPQSHRSSTPRTLSQPPYPPSVHASPRHSMSHPSQIPQAQPDSSPQLMKQSTPKQQQMSPPVAAPQQQRRDDRDLINDRSPVPLRQNISRKRKRDRNQPPPRWAQRYDKPRNVQIRGNSRPQQNGHIKREYEMEPPIPSRPAEQQQRQVPRPFAEVFTNARVSDDLSKQVAFQVYAVLEHIMHRMADNEQVEIEAKIGRILDRELPGETRYSLPVRSEVLLDDGLQIRFQSDLPGKDFARLVSVANHHTQFCNTARTVDPNCGRSPISYKRRKEVDTFYQLDQAGLALLPTVTRERLHEQSMKNNKVRVSREKDSNEILAQIVKVRIRDLHIHAPNHDFDIRISINIETQYQGDVTTLEQAQEEGRPVARDKNRGCYIFNHCEFDLTEVKSLTSDKVTHEAEVELDSRSVLDTARRAVQDATPYEALIAGFMDNVRALMREPLPPPKLPTR